MLVICLDGLNLKVSAIDVFTGKVTPLAKLNPKEFDFKMSLPVGSFEIQVDVEDVWGAISRFKIEDKILVDVPSAEDAASLLDPSDLERLEAEGDTKGLMMAIQAQVGILDGVEEVEAVYEDDLVPQPELSEEEKASQLSVKKGEFKLEAINMLEAALGGGSDNINDVATAEILASTIEAIVGEPPEDGEHSTVGVEMTEKATNVAEGLLKAVKNMEVADPKVLLPTVEYIASAMGTVLSESSKTASMDNDYDVDGDNIDMCAGLKPIDRNNVDKPGKFEYDTAIDDVDMVVPSNPEVQKCGAVIDAARTSTCASGLKIVDMMKEIAETLLKKSVVGESNVVDSQGGVSVFSSLMPPDDISRLHEPFEDPVNPTWEFPSSFCPAGTCGVPLGVTAVVFSTNPLCNVPTSDRLSQDTKGNFYSCVLSRLSCDFLVLDIDVTDRYGVNLDVRGLEEGIKIAIPRSNFTREALTGPTFYKATSHGNVRAVPYLAHMFVVEKADSIIGIEVTPVDLDVDNLVLLLSYDKIPTYMSFDLATTIQDLAWDTEGKF